MQNSGGLRALARDGYLVQGRAFARATIFPYCNVQIKCIPFKVPQEVPLFHLNIKTPQGNMPLGVSEARGEEGVGRSSETPQLQSAKCLPRLYLF
jgi:hypothetical protein